MIPSFKYQSITLSKSQFPTSEVAKRWCEEKGFDLSRCHESDDCCVFTQANRERFDEMTLQTIEISPGVTAIIGQMYSEEIYETLKKTGEVKVADLSYLQDKMQPECIMASPCIEVNPVPCEPMPEPCEPVCAVIPVNPAIIAASPLRMPYYRQFFYLSSFPNLTDFKNWAFMQLPVCLQASHGGVLATISKIDGVVKMVFDGSSEDQFERFEDYGLREKFAAVPTDFVITGEFQIERDDKSLNQIEFARAMNKGLEEDDELEFYVNDIYNNGEDLMCEPLSKRLDCLANFMGYMPSDFVEMSATLKEVDNLVDLGTAIQDLMALGEDKFFVRQLSATAWDYGCNSVVKTLLSFYAKVIRKYVGYLGAFQYSLGMPLAESDKFEKYLDMNGVKYLDLGESLETSVELEVGDVCECYSDNIWYNEYGPSLYMTAVVSRKVGKNKLQMASDLLAYASTSMYFSPIRKELIDDAAVLYAAFGVRVADEDLGEEGSEDRCKSLALKSWNETWHKQLPKSGKGKFSFHYHAQNLDEDEVTEGLETILKNCSVHGDLRFTADKKTAWGVSLDDDCDKLLSLKPGEELPVIWKMPQDPAWMYVTKNGDEESESVAIPPASNGATFDEWAKVFLEDEGEYEVGFAKEGMVELFLKGKKLTGHFYCKAIQVDSLVKWVIQKADSDTPYLEKNSIADEYTAAKAAGEAWLYAAKPGVKPTFVDMKKDLPLELIQKFEVSEQRVKILKADDEKKIVYAVVLEPESLDAHEDIIAEDEIETSAHDYLSKWRIVGHNHKKKAKAEIVESFIAPIDFTWNGQAIKKGSWVVAIRIIDDQLWQDVKDEKLTGVSIGGLSLRKKV